jgi:arylsulfatase A-like enzyme
MTTASDSSRPTARARRAAFALLVTATILHPARGLSAGAADDHGRQGVSPPNIVLILTDDQRWDTLRFMPHVREDLMSQGMTLPNAFVSNPLCCPSRASILTGNFSHTTGVYSNAPPGGGWPAFHDGGAENSTIATWLHDAGYRTALVGKYLNDYGPDNPFIPPGWDRWVAFEASSANYFDYTLNVDGGLVSYGNGAADYSTDVLAAYAVDDIEQVPSDQPLFLYLATTAPHGPATPAPRDEGTVLRGPSRWPPSFNERNMSDKPRYMRGLPDVSEEEQSSRYVKMVESLQAVDDAVHDVIGALEATGRLQNTMIVFTSDNGIAFGEHRWTSKLVPYEDSIRVPLVIRWDGVVSPGAVDRHLVANIDLAPTFAEAAEVAAPAADGRSMLPVLSGEAVGWRKLLLLEHLLHHKGLRLNRGLGPGPPTYCGIRGQHRLFVHYGSGFEEYYDLRLDPYQLRNMIGEPSNGWITRLRDATRRLCQPLPPGMSPF